MEAEQRQHFNERFSASLYETMLHKLRDSVGKLPFRVAETPVFLDENVQQSLFHAAEGLLSELCAPELNEAMQPVIPHDHCAPGMNALPDCVTLDFALAQNPEGKVEPRLVELQAFPSLYAFTWVHAQVWLALLREMSIVDDSWTSFWGDTDPQAVVESLRQTIVGDLDPEHVVLVDIEPKQQKTLPDFVATQNLLGIDHVCVSELEREGRRLYRRIDGRLVPIQRIYNRVVFDELLQREPKMSFSYRDALDVTFVPHPNWQWTWSKAVLPHLRHASVPSAHLVSQLDEIPPNLNNYVLKPLFSFAGAGVNVEPDESAVMAIPPAERSNWLLQEKIDYARQLRTPEGHGVAAEVRVLCLKRPQDERPKVLSNLTRLSRGKMLGVDFNRDFDWVGSTVSFWSQKS